MGSAGARLALFPSALGIQTAVDNVRMSWHRQSSYVAKYEGKAKERGWRWRYHQPTASGEYKTFVSETTWMMLLLVLR